MAECKISGDWFQCSQDHLCWKTEKYPAQLWLQHVEPLKCCIGYVSKSDRQYHIFCYLFAQQQLHGWSSMNCYQQLLNTWQSFVAIVHGLQQYVLEEDLDWCDKLHTGRNYCHWLKHKWQIEYLPLLIQFENPEPNLGTLRNLRPWASFTRDETE